MFTIPVVTSCPVVKASGAVIYLHPDVVRRINGLLEAESGLEWAAIGRGWTSPSGSDIFITELWIPPQSRSVAAVDIAEIDLTPQDVCVFHSHHHMGAFFSGTDLNRLNPRFPASVVVAELGPQSSPVEQAYGFAYEATALIALPCKSIGRVNAGLASPLSVVDWDIPEGYGKDFIDWEEKSIPLDAINATKDTKLDVTFVGDCPNVRTHTPVEGTSPHFIVKTLGCSNFLTEPIVESTLRSNIFGEPIDDLVKELPSPTRFIPAPNPKDKSSSSHELEGWSSVLQSEKKKKISKIEEDWYDTMYDSEVVDISSLSDDRKLNNFLGELAWAKSYNYEEFCTILKDPEFQNLLYLSKRDLILD